MEIIIFLVLAFAAGVGFSHYRDRKRTKRLQEELSQAEASSEARSTRRTRPADYTPRQPGTPINRTSRYTAPAEKRTRDESYVHTTTLADSGSSYDGGCSGGDSGGSCGGGGD